MGSQCNFGRLRKNFANVERRFKEVTQMLGSRLYFVTNFLVLILNALMKHNEHHKNIYKTGPVYMKPIFYYVVWGLWIKVQVDLP